MTFLCVTRVYIMDPQFELALHEMQHREGAIGRRISAAPSTKATSTLMKVGPPPPLSSVLIDFITSWLPLFRLGKNPTSAYMSEPGRGRPQASDSSPA